METFELKAIRNRKLRTPEFRISADALAKKTIGKIRKEPDVLIAVLRSGIILLPPAIKRFPKAKVGIVGCRRDEKTAKPGVYYINLPLIKKKDKVLILDPMLATGGTAMKTVEILVEHGANPSLISFLALIAAPEGVRKLSAAYPKINIRVEQLDKGLNKNFMIVPGIGDFGDRYFGT